MIEITPHSLRGDRPAWSTAVGLGPIPYRFAGSNPAPRTMSSQYISITLIQSGKNGIKREAKLLTFLV